MARKEVTFMSIQQEKTLAEVVILNTKVRALQVKRLALWMTHRQQYPKPRLARNSGFPHPIYEERVPIRRNDADSHPRLEEGKVRNLRLAAPHFDGLELRPGQPFSFWRTLGRITARRGFDYGMELRGGCIVPSLGGGICLLSNALFVMAARLGWKILERHGHTMEAVPSHTRPWGLDATVFWPYVDLRVEPRSSVRLGVAVAGQELVIRVDSSLATFERVELKAVDNRVSDGWRENKLLRRRSAPDGSLIAEEIIGCNRKKILHSSQRRRNCLTCGEQGCKARVVLGQGESVQASRRVES